MYNQQYHFILFQTLANVIPGGLAYEPILHRRRDPGSGALTPYHNFTFIAKEDIASGQELFASVGEGWFQYHGEANGQSIPLKEDYDKADSIIKNLMIFHERYPNITEAQFLDIIRRIKKDMIVNNAKLVMLMPESMEDFQRTAEKGAARMLLNEKSTNWLQRNGQCLDNIRTGISGVVGAGRGAFATRFIPAGSIVAPAPLVHVLDKRNFDIENDAPSSLLFGGKRTQLLMNYCFGHRKSWLLLCPTTSVTQINHSKDYNAKYQWSQSPGGNANFRMVDLDELKPNSDALLNFTSRLFFDFVATKDILEGEEILFDYGDEWVRQWRKHVERWSSPDTDDMYTPSNIYNNEKRPIVVSSKLSLHHSYLCRLEPFAREDVTQDIPEENFRANPTIMPDSWNNFTRIMYADNDFLWWWPCDVTAANAENTVFSTLVYKKSSAPDKDVIRRLKNVPRDAIQFVDKPYHSDQHLISAFRHYIPIRDDIFPLHWRDDYKDVRLGAKNILIRDEYSNSFDKELQQAKCGVYVAPSTVPNAGKGTYCGVTMPGKGFILGAEVPVIPVVNMVTTDHWDANDYTWSSSNFHAEFETTSQGSSQILVVNEGCMANFHPGLVNVAISDVTYEPALDRRKDPGAGAFSDYLGASFSSLYEVEAGREVFISCTSLLIQLS